MTATVLAYAYEADMHCVSCTKLRFPDDWTGSYLGPDATDAEGNPVGALFSYESWCEPTELGPVYLTCGDCGDIIDAHYNRPDGCYIDGPDEDPWMDEEPSEAAEPDPFAISPIGTMRGDEVMWPEYESLGPVLNPDGSPSDVTLRMFGWK